MTLGEKIYTLRNQCNMSQGDLAEQLEVSRQSISKWETDTSVPTLDKLIQLSELFHITLDELVKGDNTPSPTPEPQKEPETTSQPVTVIVPNTYSTKKIVGTILLCFGTLTWLLLTFLGGFLTGLLLCSPFVVCGIICLTTKKNTGLWCAWALFLMVNLYLRYATGISWRMTLFTFSFEPSMNYMRLLFAWVELICFIVMITITVKRFQEKTITWSRRNTTLYIVGWIVFALLFIPVSAHPLSFFSRIRFLFLDWIKVSLFTILWITTLRLIRNRKHINQ